MPAFFLQNMLYDSVGLTELDIPHIYTLLIIITSIYYFQNKRGKGDLFQGPVRVVNSFERGKTTSDS